MAIAEKLVTPRASYIAIGIAFLISGGIWFGGQKNPDVWTSNMAKSHHNEYGATLQCFDCHQPSKGAYMTAPGCLTAKCHGELMDGGTREEKIVLAIANNFQENPDAKFRAEHYLAMHEAFKARECAECHTEHTDRPTVFPDGWTAYAPAATVMAPAKPGWVSLM